MKEKILVSACLLGENCRYDAKNSLKSNVLNFLEKYEIIKVCPEVLGGLSIPREPAEIQNGNFRGVLTGECKILTKTGNDVTSEFLKGSFEVLKIARDNNIKIAILKQNSPSCGSKQIYDGSFLNNKVDGMGICTYLLKKQGLKVFSENDFK